MAGLNGRVIKNYEVRELIGAGAFGAVYRAVQLTVGRDVAIKVIHPRHANEPEFIRRFELEAQLIARLEHPHIVPLHDYWRDPTGAYLVMRWLPRNLRQALEDGPLPLATAARVVEQIASALAAAHRQGVVHRDIKPENILLDEDDNTYLADFGIAVDSDLLGVKAASAASTAGSSPYLSPEQLRQEPVTPGADTYSLGIVLYEMLTGRSAFAITAPAELVEMQPGAPLPPLAASRSDLPAGIDAVLSTATAPSPEHRYPDISRFAAAFRAIATPPERREPQPLPEPLTERELDILGLMVEGLDNKEIARRLYLSLTTVKWYNRQIYGKLDVHSRYAAVERARALGLLAPREMAGAAPAASAASGSGAGGAPFEPEPLLPEPVNPYKGLRAFQEADANDYFGRSTLVGRLLARLAEPEGARFLAVVGPSGSGKSSLVRAGLVPALRSGGLPGSAEWFFAELLPGTHPYEELEAALLRVSVSPQPDLLSVLREDERGLARAAKRVLPADSETELVILIDQFEEVFTLVEDDEERGRFLDMLVAALEDDRSRVRVVVTLRADFYDRPLLHVRFAALVRNRTEVVVPLDELELREAIEEPAARAGVALEPALVPTIVAEVSKQPGALPLLQYALTELFEEREGRRLTLGAYARSGGVRGALAKRADELYASLDDAGRGVAKQLFLRLVTLGEGTEDTRRRALASEITSLDEGGAADEVVEAFGRYRLLTFDRDPLTRRPTVEIAHEALIREWGLLRGWLAESRDEVRMQRSLAGAAAEWKRSGEDPSYLLTGSRLAELEAWAASSDLVLAADEREFLKQSVGERERREAAEGERRAREVRLERRSKRFLQSLAGVLLIATLAAAGLTSFAFSERRSAQTNFARAESQRLASLANNILLSRGSPELAALLSARAVSIEPSVQADLALQAAARLDFGEQLFRLGLPIHQLAVSPDGRYLLAISQDNEPAFWEIASGKVVRRLPMKAGGDEVAAFSPNGRRVLVGGADNTAVLWDVDSGTELVTFVGHGDRVDALAFSPDGRTVLTGSSDGTAKLWSANTGEEIRTFTGTTRGAIAFSPDGTLLLTDGPDYSLQLWDVTTGERLRTLYGHENVVTSISFTRDARRAVTTSWDKTARLWDVTTGDEDHRFTGHTDILFDAALSPDDRYLLTGSLDTSARLWDLASGEEVRQFKGHTAAVYSVALSPDGRSAFTAGKDGTARLWNLEAPAERNTFHAGTGWTYGVAFSHDGSRLYTINAIGGTREWDIATGARLRDFTKAVIDGDVALSPDGAMLATGTQGGDVARLWQAQTGELVTSLPVIAEGIDFAPDGTTLVTAGDGVHLWDARSGKPLRTLSDAPAADAVFSADGRFVLSGSDSPDGARLWDATTGADLRHFPLEAGVVRVAFSPDARLMLTASRDNTARLWDVGSGELLRELAGHSNIVWDVRFSPDGRYVLTGAQDGTARLWDTESGRQLRVLSGHGGSAIRTARFSPDGRSIAIGSSDGRVQLVETELADLVASVCSRVLRDLLPEERAQYELDSEEPACSR